MPHSLQVAPTGRAKCRGCGKSIARGELRFGETGPNSYGEGEATTWYHVSCAALMRPDQILPVLGTTAEQVAERQELMELATEGVRLVRLPRLVRAERASSGRAHCRQCRELIHKGDWRLALQVFEEGRPSPIGTIHAWCAEAYFGTRALLPRLRRLTPELGADDWTSLSQAIAPRGPGVAKAYPDAGEHEAVEDARSRDAASKRS